MRYLKKTIAALLVLCMIIPMVLTSNACADSISEKSGTLVVLAEGLESIYDASVVSRMSGRAGAKSPYGGKGIAFEIKLADKLNLMDLFKLGTKTSLSKNSTDQLADLVTTANSEAEKLIQCKDGTSPAQISKVLKEVESGKYAEADLFATTEFAEAFNAKATEKGITQLATDSGISTENTSKVAAKNLGKIEGLAKSTLKAAEYSALISSALSIAESIVNGDNVYEATGNVVTNTTVATVSTCICPLTEAAMLKLLSSVGVCATAATASSAVVSILVSTAAGYSLYLLVDEYNIEETVASIAAYAGNNLKDAYGVVREYLDEINLEDSVKNVTESAKTSAQSSLSFVKRCSTVASTAAKNCYHSAVSFFGSLF